MPEDELFLSAIEDVTPTEAEQQPAIEQAEQTQEQEAQDQAAPTEAQPEPQEKKPEQDHRVPLVELLNEREKRQNFERQLEEERRQRQAIEQQLRSHQQPKPTEIPDIFENPKGFVETVEQAQERRFREYEANLSLKLAHREYKQEFVTAYNDLLKEGQINPSLVQGIVNSADPGESLMSWHRQRMVYQEIGGDLSSYRKKIEEELLASPEHRKRVADQIRQESSSAQKSGRSDPVVQIPPSLSKISGAPPVHSDDDGSDAALFQYATRR